MEMEKTCKRKTGCRWLVFLLTALVLLLPHTDAAAQKTVFVNNVYELMEALADDTEIVLAPGRYDISEWGRDNAAQKLVHPFGYNELSPAGLYRFDGLEICGFRNLTIRGRDVASVTAEIVQEDRYEPVLNFRNCHGLKLANLRAGHVEGKGYCSGAVLNFAETSGVEIRNADLYGCGTYGYEARNCNGITVYDSVIRDCTYGLISASNSTGLRCLRTTFKDTSTNLQLLWMESSQVELTDCVFDNVYGSLKRLRVSTGLHGSN